MYELWIPLVSSDYSLGHHHFHHIAPSDHQTEFTLHLYYMTRMLLSQEAKNTCIPS